MHTSGGAACGRDDDGGDAPELCMCRSLPRTKIKEYSRPVNGRITTSRSILELNCRCNSWASALPPNSPLSNSSARATSAAYSRFIGIVWRTEGKSHENVRALVV